MADQLQPNGSNPLLGEVLRSAMFAADDAALRGGYLTHAEETRAVVRAAFELALGNGLIRIAPRDEWPTYISLDPPYEQPPAVPR